MKKLISSFLLLALAVPASAAIVYLKDGSQVHGTIVSATARDVRLHTVHGDLTIPADDIRRVDYAEDEPQVVPTEANPPAVNPPEPEPMPSRRQARMRARQEQEAEEAEATSGNQMLSIGFGFATPVTQVNLTSTGDNTGGRVDNGDTGLLLGTQYHYFVTPRLAFGADLDFLNRSQTASQSGVADANTKVFGNSTVLMATVRYSLTDRGGARPYVMAGLGTNRTSTIIEARPNPGFGWTDEPIDAIPETRTLVDESHWGLASTARIGIDFLLAEPTLFSLEFGWTGISNSQYGATRAGNDLGLEHVTGDLSIITIGARWGWRF